MTGFMPFLDRIQAHLPGIDTQQSNWKAILPETDTSQENWEAATKPRPCMFGPLEWGSWKWHLVADILGLPMEIRQVVDLARTDEIAAQAIREHKMSVMVFLMAAPKEAGVLDRMQALCKVAWALVDAGADVLIWPVGRSAIHRKWLEPVGPSAISADQAHLFVSCDFAGAIGDRFWLRTYGMSQFQLPDLACIAANTPEEVEAANVLLNSFPRYLIQRQQPIPVGDTVECEKWFWKVTESGTFDIPALRSDFGVQVFTRLA